jgi:hypothetical protein
MSVTIEEVSTPIAETMIKLLELIQSAPNTTASKLELATAVNQLAEANAWLVAKGQAH